MWSDLVILLQINHVLPKCLRRAAVLLSSESCMNYEGGATFSGCISKRKYVTAAASHLREHKQTVCSAETALTPVSSLKILMPLKHIKRKHLFQKKKSQGTCS